MLHPRQGVSFPLILVGIIAVAAVGGTVLYFRSDTPVEATIDPILHVVKKTDFVAQILCEGEVQSSENVEIKNEVRARSGKVTVLRAVPEGTAVKEGDFLVELDSSIFEKDLEQQRLAVSSAETQMIQAKAAFRTAEVAVKEYELGTFVEQQTKLNLDLDTAKQELTMAQDKLTYSNQMQARGFITDTQRESDALAVKKAKRNITLINKQIEVLEKFTKEKEMIKLNSDVEAALVRKGNEEEMHKLEVDKLKEIQDLIEKCTIRVPPNVSGQVVYHKEYSRRGNSEWVLEPGAEVREGQVLVRLPDPEKMEVKALVQEQSITSIEVGMPAEIRVDALSGKVLNGVVAKVNRYAEPSGWMSSNVRKYAVYVTILNPPKSLIPGMNTSVTIQIRHEKDAVQVPVQSLYGVQGRFFCLQKVGDEKFETTEVEVDGDNTVFAIVKKGIQEGDNVVMNPNNYKSVMKLPKVVYNKPIEADQKEIQKVVNQAKTAPKKSSSGDPRIDGMFAKYDKNSDDTIDKSELESIDSKSRRFVSMADGNKDGKITKKEMIKVFQKFSRGRPSGGRGGGGH